MTSPASQLAALSLKARRKKYKTKRAFNQSMRDIAKLPRPSRRKLDKTAK